MVSTIHEVNQWGRKDPFTPATHSDYVTHENAKEVQIYNAAGNPITKGHYGIGTADEEFKYDNTTETTINHLIQNPSTYYDKGDKTNTIPIASAEYYNITKEGDWWNPTIKTLYDPCPNGYRIPKSGTYGEGRQVETHPDWSPWSDGGLQSGRVFKNSSFFPASGYRVIFSCELGDVGTHNFSWMSTPSSATLGYTLGFHFRFIYQNYSDYHSYGFTTRCIRDPI